MHAYTHAVCGQYACGLTTHVHLDVFTGVLLFRVVSLLVVNMDTSRGAPKPLQDNGTGENERGLDMQQKTAELER